MAITITSPFDPSPAAAGPSINAPDQQFIQPVSGFPAMAEGTVYPDSVPAVEVMRQDERINYQRKMAEWQAKAQATVDSAALDPATFYKGADLSIYPDPHHAQILSTNDSAMELLSGRQDIPMQESDIQRKLLRQELAIQHFQGKGGDSEASFHAEVVKAAQGRKATQALYANLTGGAATYANQSREDLGYGTPEDTAQGFQRWREANKGKPGYDSAKDADYLEAWNQQTAHAKEAIDRFRPELDSVWSAMVAKKDYAAAAENAYDSLPPDQRDKFMAALALRARAMPEAEQATFWANFKQRSSQDVGGLVDNALDFGLVLGPHANSVSMYGGTAGVDQAALPGSPAATAQAAKNRARINFRNEVVKIQQADYDPLKLVAPEGLQWAEKIAYGTAGVFTSSAMSIVAPGVLAVSQNESHYQSLREDFMKSGQSAAAADRNAQMLAPLAAGVELVSERLGAKLLIGKLPFLEKSLGGAIDKIKSGAGRFVARSLAGGAEAGVQEVGQNYIDPLVRQLGRALQMDVPAVQWTGQGGELEHFWSMETLDTFLAVLPLVIFLGVGGVKQDRQVRAFASASDLELKALGIKGEAIPVFREAVSQGMGSANLALEKAWQERDAMSPEAKQASADLAAEIAAQKAAVVEAKASGMMPIIKQSADGYSVHDGETGQEIGTATDREGAMRLATAHSAALDDSKAEKIAYLASMLDAGAEVLTMDPSGTAQNSFETGTTYTEATAAAESPASIDQFHAQAAQQERVNGGNGEVSMVALGRNVQELRAGVRTFTNRLFAGASVTTIVHEMGHGMLRRLEESGVIVRDEKMQFVRAVDSVFSGQAMRRGEAGIKGQSLSLLPEGIADEDVTDQMLGEAISHILEAEILRTRKRAKENKAVQLSPGIISRNLLALSRMAPGATRKFRAFIEAARGTFGLSSARALAMKKAEREGKFDVAKHEAFLDKLTGRDLQAEHDGIVRDEHAAILGQEKFTPTEDEPFSLVPIGPGTRMMEAAPAVVRIDKDPFAGAATANPHQWRATWKQWERENRQKWRKTIVLPEGDVTISAVTLNEIGEIRRQDQRAHFEAASALPQLLEHSALAAVETPNPEKRNVQEVHKRYAWMTTSDGRNSHVLITLMRWKGEHAVADTAYSVESIEVQKESAVGNLELETPPTADGATNGGTDNLARFLAGIKPEHRWSAPFSLAPARMVDALQMNAAARIKDPRVKAAIFTRMLGKLGELKRDRDELGIAFGKGYKRKAIDDPRKAASIRKEANFREATLRAKYEDEAYAKHGDILSNTDLTKLKEQPVHAHLADPSSRLRGRLMSKAAALAKGESFFDGTKQGDFDGADGVSRANFGGTLMPDRAAQELFDAHLIKEPAADAMWDALKRESASVARFKDYLKAAQADVAQGRAQAKSEARAWETERLKEEAANYSPRQQLLRSLSMLDGILSVLPAETRGKIGGYTQLAKLTTDEARLKFLTERIARADAEIEKFLVWQYGKMWDDLLDREQVKKNAPGKRPKGKAGADVHALFAVLRQAENWTADQAETHAAALDAQIAKGEMTTAAEAHAILEASLVRQIGGWHPVREQRTNPTTGKESSVIVSPGADAATRATFIANATRVFDDGYYKFRFEKLMEREDRGIRRDFLKAATGKAGTAAERDAKILSDNKLKGGWKNIMLNFGSFEQLMHYVFGEKSTEAKRLVDMERAASNHYSDAVFAKTDAISDLFTTLGGGGLAGEKLRHAMAQKSHTIDGRQMSEFESMTATLPERIAAIAESKIGLKESPPGSNRGPEIQEFFSADNYDPNGKVPGDDGYAWCAAFVDRIVQLAMAGRSDWTFARPVTPGAWDMERWSLAQDASTNTKTHPGADIKRGDLLVYRFSHIGIATGPPDRAGYIPTVEGNTNDRGEREGIKVAAKLRSILEIRSRIRFTV